MTEPLSSGHKPCSHRADTNAIGLQGGPLASLVGSMSRIKMRDTASWRIHLSLFARRVCFPSWGLHAGGDLMTAANRPCGRMFI